MLGAALDSDCRGTNGGRVRFSGRRTAADDGEGGGVGLKEWWANYPVYPWVVPTITVETSAPAEVAMAAVVGELVDARYRLQERDAGRARLRIGSHLRLAVFEPFDPTRLVKVPRRVAAWGIVANVDVEAIRTTPPTQVRVQMHGIWGENRIAVPHLLETIDAATRALQAAGHSAEAGEVTEGGEGRLLRPASRRERRSRR